MRFTPASISVPAGNRLVVVLTNTNTDTEDVHDLVLDTGADSGRLAPGQTAHVDVGVVGRSLEGWRSVIGHKQMGMVLSVDVTGSAPSTAAETTAGHDAHQHRPGGTKGDEAPGDAEQSEETQASESAPATGFLDLMSDPSPGWMARDAALPPLSSRRLHRRTFVIRDVDREVAPGVTQRVWTYNGTAPGPVLHGRVGDRFEITLINRGSVGHSIDFHAGALAPQGPMRTIAPGKSLTYKFRATRAGVWMYHCSTMPMSAHIANGLFGAVVIEPPNLPRVDRTNQYDHAPWPRASGSASECGSSTPAPTGRRRSTWSAASSTPPTPKASTCSGVDRAGRRVWACKRHRAGSSSSPSPSWATTRSSRT